MGALIFWILALVIVVIVIGGLKKKLTNSSSLVVTGPGVLKTHNVECRFWSEPEQGGVYHGKLSQDRWSDGQERFSLRLHKLPEVSEKVALFRDEQLVSEFDADGKSVNFAWKGMSTQDIPQFEIGEKLFVQCGSKRLSGTVEAD